MNYEIFENKLRADIAAMKERREWEVLKAKLDLDYMERKSKYDMECAMLTFQREQFYAANPDFPIKTMFMQVTAPPQKIEINIL